MVHFSYLPPNPESEVFLRYENLRPKPGKEAVLLHGACAFPMASWALSKHATNDQCGVDVQGLRLVGVEGVFVLLMNGTQTR